MARKKTEKQAALIKAARLLIQQKGLNQTTLADIATNSDIPLGNVYYYFKTKEEIGKAVITDIDMEYQDFFKKLDTNSDPKIRLTLFIQSSIENLESITRYGCELGSLSQELSKKGGNLANQLAKVLNDSLNWCKTQFNSLGFKEASHLALHLVSSLQGSYLLAQTFKDPSLIKKQVKHIQAWLEQLVLKTHTHQQAIA